MAIQDPTGSSGTGTLHELRQNLSALHDVLRNEGLTPIEAAHATARGLARGADVDLSGPAKAHLERIAHTAYAPASLLALLYQEFLVAEARSGLGQYLTPLPVADLIARVLQDRVSDSPAVLDPFCGAGILLDRFAALRPDASLIGLEINPGIAAISRTLADIAGHRLSIESCDAFERWGLDAIEPVDLVLTNPPFGAVASQMTIESLRARVPPPLRAMKRVPAELLGLELAISVLAPDGCIGIVLPSSVLTNSTWSAYRRSIIERLKIDGVVFLPEETFAAFRGVARACVVFGTRQTHTCSSFSGVPVYRSRSVGYTDTGRTSDTPSDMGQAVDCMRRDSDSQWKLEIDETGHAAVYCPSTMDDLSCVMLGDISHIFTGRTPHADDYATKGPFVLKVGNLQNGFVSWSKRRRSHISQNAFRRYSKFHLQPGDICLTAAAHRPRYIGHKVDLLYELPSSGAIPSAEVMVIRLNPDAPLLPEELLFYLRSDEGYQQLQDRVRGSTAHLYARDMVDLPVPLTLPNSESSAVGLYREAARLHRDAVIAEQIALKAAGLPADIHDFSMSW